MDKKNIKLNLNYYRLNDLIGFTYKIFYEAI